MVAYQAYYFELPFREKALKKMVLFFYTSAEEKFLLS
jgi:hypothetical protein